MKSLIIICLSIPDLTFHNEIDAKHTMQLAIPEEKLKQLLIIIIDNAIKYSGENKEMYFHNEYNQ